jgi:nucleoside-diphosphate-sugar epimerase
MKILVLGSDGQIGQPLTQYLKKLSNEVIEFDIYSNPITDLRIPNILDNILPIIDFVFFLAFDVGGSVYLKVYQDSYEFISNNIKIMNNTFDSLKKHNTPFIFASSQMSEMSYSSYGILKHIGEKYTNCLNGKVLKFWNVYGFERDLNKSHVITDFIMMAKNYGSIQMKTTGEEVRQFLYVDDCSECLNIVMNNFHEIKERHLDVSGFEWIKIKDLAKLIALNFNNCFVICGNDSDDVQRDALKEPNKKILNYWTPKISLNQGIKSIIDKYEN